MSDKSAGYGKKYLEISRQLRDQSGFSGSAEQLLGTVESLAPLLQLEPEGDSGNERLLRHYASVSVVDKPTRQGRDAVYTYRHLLQFLTARRLMKQGFALSKIAEFTSVVPTETLEQALCEEPQRSEAELLVAAYKAGSGQVAEAQVARNRAPTQSSSRSTPSWPDPLFGMADVMHEIEKMRSRFMAEIYDMQLQVQKSLHAVERTSEILDRLQVDSAKNLQWVIDERAQTERRLEDRLMQLADMTAVVHKQTDCERKEMSIRLDQLNERTQLMIELMHVLQHELMQGRSSTNPKIGN